MSALLVQVIALGAGLAALTGSAVTDLKARIIPNEFVVLIAFCGLALSLSRGGHVLASLLAAIATFIALGVLAHYDVIGGGDVKLISAATLLVPADGVGMLLLQIALAGGVLSCLYLAAGLLLRRCHGLRQCICKTGRGSRSGRWRRLEGTRVARGYPMPYAVAILGGVTVHIMRELPKCLSAISCSL